MADPYDVTVDMTVVSRGPDPDGGYRHVLRNAPGSTLMGAPVEVDYLCTDPLDVGSQLRMELDSRNFTDGTGPGDATETDDGGTPRGRA